MGALLVFQSPWLIAGGGVELVMIGERIVDRSDFLPRRPKDFLDFPTMDRAFLALCYCCQHRL